MTDFLIEAAAVGWLRYERRCVVVAMQRGLYHGHRPDVLGVAPGRQAIEIEVKRTLSDFKADASKRITSWRAIGAVNTSQFYYAVPQALTEKVRPLLPTWAGLLTLGSDIEPHTGLPRLTVARPAPRNAQARKLSRYEVARLVAAQTATMQRLLVRIVRLEQTQP